jgi:hypothetical protein
MPAIRSSRRPGKSSASIRASRRPNTRIRAWDGVGAVEARADKSMALLGRPLEVDLQRRRSSAGSGASTRRLPRADMTKKSGDDYAARVYLNFDVPPDQLDFATRTKLALGRTLYGDHLPDAAINYIWDNRHPVGTWQNNVYTDRARMLVLRSGADEAGHWVIERRDVREDFQRRLRRAHRPPEKHRAGQRYRQHRRNGACRLCRLPLRRRNVRLPGMNRLTSDWL